MTEDNRRDRLLQLTEMARVAAQQHMVGEPETEEDKARRQEIAKLEAEIAAEEKKGDEEGDADKEAPRPKR